MAGGQAASQTQNHKTIKQAKMATKVVKLMFGRNCSRQNPSGSVLSLSVQDLKMGSGVRKVELCV